MGFPQEPSPFPTLQKGLALGASEHAGFVAVFNWIAKLMRKASSFFCLGINGRTGKLNLVAGTGISVTVSGSTITIAQGNGENIDADAWDPSGGGDSDDLEGGDNRHDRLDDEEDDGSGGSSWTSARPASPPAEPPDSCNEWTDDTGNEGADDGVGNEGDNCSELNGW